MPPLKDRIPVVFDTNIFITFHLSTNPDSANSKIYRLWRNQRRLQLIVSDEIINEYIIVLERLGVPDKILKIHRQRFEERSTVTGINSAFIPAASRYPDDNAVLAAAKVGKADYLITHYRDLLDLPGGLKNRFNFQIVTPAELLDLLSR